MEEITTFSGQTTTPDKNADQEQLIAALLARVGERVRRARELKRLPRRALSDLSGLSQRYLVQLEAGEGNISIGLLQRVADALDFKLEWLVSEEDPWTSESLQVVEAYQSASKETREKVRNLLQSEGNASGKRMRICLTGLRGAGKSSLGQMVAEALQLPFVELNREIENYSGMPVHEVMALYGQDGYRRLEAQTVERVIATYDAVVLAVAGGIVAEPETFHRLMSNFHTIWLKATPEEHMARVRAQGDERPMAGNPEAMEQLKAILSSREVLYGQADMTLDTSGKSLETSYRELLGMVELIKANS